MKTLSALRGLASLPKAPAPVVVGFDGFVDEMISVVAERTSLDDFVSIPDIPTFGSLISAAAGHSSLREIVVNAVQPGGCAVNLGDGLAALGGSGSIASRHSGSPCIRHSGNLPPVSGKRSRGAASRDAPSRSSLPMAS